MEGPPGAPGAFLAMVNASGRATLHGALPARPSRARERCAFCISYEVDQGWDESDACPIAGPIIFHPSMARAPRIRPFPEVRMLCSASTSLTSK